MSSCESLQDVEFNTPRGFLQSLRQLAKDEAYSECVQVLM